MKYNDTERLDFILNHTVEWQGLKNKGGTSYFELEVWDGGEIIAFAKANTQRNGIDLAMDICKK